MASRFVISIDNKYVCFVHSQTKKPVFNRSPHEAQKFDWYAQAEKFVAEQLGGKGDIETYLQSNSHPTYAGRGNSLPAFWRLI